MAFTGFRINFGVGYPDRNENLKSANSNTESWFIVVYYAVDSKARAFVIVVAALDS